MASHALELPEKTSRFNRGNVSGRYRDANGKRLRFELQHEVAVLDGAGREFARVVEPVMLNRGVAKRMRADGAAEPETYVWGFSMRTTSGDLRRCSGWISRTALVHPPDIGSDDTVNPKPPREGAALEVDCEKAMRKLRGLRFKDSSGAIPKRGNHGTDYAGRNPGPRNFVYLCFNVPNVVRGGVAKDSIRNGGLFVPGLDENGKPIRERMTMYRHRHHPKPVPVHFVYGRPADRQTWGWLAQANVGRILPPG
jgi:hypothetical protein